MSVNLRRRAETGLPGEADVGEKLLHTLEGTQSRVHSDPDSARLNASPERDPSRTNSPTVTWHEIPSWQQDNEYILTGYRR